MVVFDEPMPDIAKSKKSKIKRIEFNNIYLSSEEKTWGVEIAVDVFDSDRETPSGIAVGIFYLGKRVGSSSTDDWGNAIINIKNLPVPEPRDTPVKFEARIKGQEIRAWTDEMKVPMTKEEIKAEEERIAEEERKRKEEEEHRKRKEEEKRKRKEEEERKRNAEEERKRKIKEEKERGMINVDNKFYICDHPVTQKEYKAVMDKNPSNHKGDNNPVEEVSWFDAVDYCNRRSIKEGLEPVYNINGEDITWDESKIGYRLPTEAEWEYAAKGGSKSKGDTFSGSSNIDEVAWYDGNSGDKTHPVKGKKANELGLYDMSGNVWEWCWDWYNVGSYRVYRGGSWNFNAVYCTVSFRGHVTPGGRRNFIGFRVALSQVKKQAGI